MVTSIPGYPRFCVNRDYRVQIYGLCNFFSTDTALIYSVKQLQIFFQTNFLFICFQNWKLYYSFAKKN